MSRAWGALVGALAAGTLFGLGLARSGMTDTAKVRGFLDFTGAWDSSLLFVMGGAVLVDGVASRRIARRAAPLFDGRFHLPTRRDLNASLVGGSALFGVGWSSGASARGPASCRSRRAPPRPSPSWPPWPLGIRIVDGART